MRRRQLVAELPAGGRVAGSYGATRTDFTSALESLTADGGLLARLSERLVAQRVPLDRAVVALAELARRGRPGKTVVDVRP